MADEYGPFATEQDAWATEAYAAERAAWDANPVPGESDKWNLRLLVSACEELGIHLGAYDLSPLRQVALYETPKCVALRGIIRRAFEAGKAAGPDNAVTEWGARFRDEDGNLSAAVDCGHGPEGEQTARRLSGTSRKDNLTGIVLRREVGPWKEAPDA